MCEETIYLSRDLLGKSRTMNVAYIDGQNLQMATRNAANPWRIDFRKFRKYLRDKYGVGLAYYFVGVKEDAHAGLYASLRHAGFVVMFREHVSDNLTHKKGNVDTDVVFQIMKEGWEGGYGVVLVSGDGDYFRTVDYMLYRKRMVKILFPSHANSSSLYKKVPTRFKTYLDDKDVKRKRMKE